MRNGFPPRLILWLIIPVTSIGLIFFYIKYVPLVTAFQLLFLPLLLLVFLLTALDAERGTLYFVFLFPLVNGLPYFFGIHEPFPHAPAALVLFLFYFQGWLIHLLAFNKKLFRPSRLFRPILLLSALILISAVITVFRYANFFPFGADAIYELAVNTNGVTTGGAIMSVVFSALNYLTGFAFLAILVSSTFSGGFVRKSFLVLTWSALIALLFGLFQHFINGQLGNNPTSIAAGIINGTFKDALSFGAFLAMISPLLLAMTIISRGRLRMAAALAFLLSLYMAFFTGSKIGFFCLLVSLAVFLLFQSAAILQRLRKFRRPSWAGLAAAVFLILAISLTATGVFPGMQGAKTLTRFQDFRPNLEYRTTRLWPLGLSMLKDYPLTGVGVGSYIIELSNYAQKRRIDIQPESSENYFIQVASELGVCGILLILWILVEIIRLLKTRYREAARGTNQKLLLGGALSGLVAFGLLVLWHTYIGSYEIHYLFWLLASLVLLGESRGAGFAENPPFGKTAKISGVVLLAAFSGVLLWNATHSLSLEAQRQKLGLDRAFGLFGEEQTKEALAFRWTGRSGGLPLTITGPRLELSLLASHPDIQSRPVKVSLSLLKGFFRQKKPLGEVVLSRPVWETFIFSVPWVGEEDVILLLKVSRTWNPLITTGAPDPRNLGVAIGPVYFRD